MGFVVGSKKIVGRGLADDLADELVSGFKVFGRGEKTFIGFGVNEAKDAEANFVDDIRSMNVGEE